MAKRIALFGGSFDPIHVGHLIVARSVAEQLQLDKVIFLPAADPPHKHRRSLTNAGHRAEMVRLAIEGEAVFSFDDHDLTRPGPCYTFDTVTHFRNVLGPNVSLHWLIGSDSLTDLPTWHRVAELVDACRIVTARRPGSSDAPIEALQSVLLPAQVRRMLDGIVSSPVVDVSATDIRQRVQTGKSIRYLVPDAVLRYILEKKLYSN